MSTDSERQSQALSTVRKSIFWLSLPFGILGFALPIIGKEQGAQAPFYVNAAVLAVCILVIALWLKVGHRPSFI